MTQKNNFKKKDLLILSIILLIALSLRLYKIDIPLADFHSWRQADTAAVARNFVRFGFDLLHPRYDDLSSIQSGLENPQGYRMVEFPIYNALFAYAYKVFPVFSLEIFGRLTTIFFSLMIIAILYYFCLKESRRTTAVFASLTYAILPFFVFFSRVILPDIPAVAGVFLSILFLYFYSRTKDNQLATIIYYLLAILFFALSLLIKPVTIFYGLAMVYLFFRRYSWSMVKKISVYVFFITALLPLVLWRHYINQFPEGVPRNYWLISQVNTYLGRENIFFRPAFFRWIFYERINNIILGGCLTFLFILGTLSKPKKYFLHFLLLSALAFLFVIQGGNVQHEYYQIMILPTVAIFVGLGTNHLIEYKKNFLHPLLLYPSIFLIFTFSIFFSYFKVKDYYQYSTELIQIAKIVNTLTKPEDKVVTDRLGDTTLLYLMDRRGAPAIYKEINEFKKLGYRYLVTQNPDLITQLKKKQYPIIFENNNFALIEL